MAIEGERIRLREQRREDLQYIVEIKNDFTTQAWSQRLAPDLTLEMAEKRYMEREYSSEKSNGILIIEDKITNEVIGYTSYYDVKPRFSVGIGVALRKQFFKNGYGKEACELLMGFLFHEFGLKTLFWYTTSWNEASIKLGYRLGFKEAMRLRQNVYMSGDLYDNVTLDILREEYYALHPELTDNLPPL